MKKREFEKLANCEVSEKEFERIETLCMNFGTMFPTKEDLVSFFNVLGMSGIDRLYADYNIIKCNVKTSCAVENVVLVDTNKRLLEKIDDLESLVCAIGTICIYHLIEN